MLIKAETERRDDGAGNRKELWCEISHPSDGCCSKMASPLLRCIRGGYSKENLAYFAASHFAERRKRRRIEDEVDEDELPYADMFNQQISSDANEWLKSHPSPSVVLAQSFFASAAFAPERTILSLATSGPGKALPDISFNVGESHLLWTVAVKSPLEIILTWELESLGLAKELHS